MKGISKAKKSVTNAKAQEKTTKKTTLSDKRKNAVKVPGTRSASWIPASKSSGKEN